MKPGSGRRWNQRTNIVCRQWTFVRPMRSWAVTAIPLIVTLSSSSDLCIFLSNSQFLRRESAHNRRGT